MKYCPGAAVSVKEDMVMTPVASAEPSTCPCSWGCSNSPRAAVDVTVKAALTCLLLAGLDPAQHSTTGQERKVCAGRRHDGSLCTQKRPGVQRRSLSQANATLPLLMQGLLVSCLYMQKCLTI